jgi:hypothetical protein
MAVKIFEVACFAGGVDIIFLQTEEDITNEQFNSLCRKETHGLGRDATVKKLAEALTKNNNFKFKKVVPDGKFFLL